MTSINVAAQTVKIVTVVIVIVHGTVVVQIQNFYYVSSILQRGNKRGKYLHPFYLICSGINKDYQWKERARGKYLYMVKLRQLHHGAETPSNQ